MLRSLRSSPTVSSLHADSTAARFVAPRCDHASVATTTPVPRHRSARHLSSMLVQRRVEKCDAARPVVLPYSVPTVAYSTPIYQQQHKLIEDAQKLSCQAVYTRDALHLFSSLRRSIPRPSPGISWIDFQSQAVLCHHDLLQYRIYHSSALASTSCIVSHTCRLPDTYAVSFA